MDEPRHITAEDRTLAFLASFNRIDAELRHRTGLDTTVEFSTVVSCAKLRKEDAKHLRAFAKLRNALDHNMTVPGRYLAIPEPDCVETIHSIEQRVLRPVLVFPRFKRSVVSLARDATITAVLALIRENAYSQFPVIADGAVIGLVTECGLTRWFAHHVHAAPNGPASLVELDDHRVADVLALEEAADGSGWYAFVARTSPLEDVAAMFGERLGLEAVLITETAKPDESLLGIVTRWDILNAAGSP